VKRNTCVAFVASSSAPIQREGPHRWIPNIINLCQDWISDVKALMKVREQSGRLCCQFVEFRLYKELTKSLTHGAGSILESWRRIFRCSLHEAVYTTIEIFHFVTTIRRVWTQGLSGNLKSSRVLSNCRTWLNKKWTAKWHMRLGTRRSEGFIKTYKIWQPTSVRKQDN
jgi:hypothetical protein